MHSIAWWPMIVLLAIAVVVDLYSRRIPNWLVLPFIAAGTMTATVSHGGKGLALSLNGIALAIAASGIFCWLRGMGMGDLKLFAAVGAWIGPGQLGMALVGTGLAGGAIALIWAACHGTVGETLDGTSDLVTRLFAKGVRIHPALVLENPAARTMPYAPAIALGTIFSFLTT